MGVWLSTDPKDQFFNPYGYSTNPINTIDPDGQYVVGAIIGAAVGAYLGGAMSNGSLNPGKWDWSDPGTFMGMFSGALSGASMGSGIENSIIKQAHLNNIGNGGLKTTYAQEAYLHSLRAGPVYTDLKNAYADAYFLNDPKGARFNDIYFGHNGSLVGNDEFGYFYYSREGRGFPSQRHFFSSYEEFLEFKDPATGMLMKERYSRILKFETTPAQDWEMIKYGDWNYNTPFSTRKSNCADLNAGIFRSGGLSGYPTGWYSIPNQQYNNMFHYLYGTIK